MTFSYGKITDVTFSDGKITIGILIRNHLGTPLFTQAILYLGHFSIDYGELISITEGYMTGSSISNLLIVESRSLKAVNSFTSREENFLSLELWHHISLIIPFLLPLPLQTFVGSGIARLTFLQKLLYSLMYLWNGPEIYHQL